MLTVWLHSFRHNFLFEVSRISVTISSSFTRIYFVVVCFSVLYSWCRFDFGVYWLHCVHFGYVTSIFDSITKLFVIVAKILFLGLCHFCYWFDVMHSITYCIVTVLIVLTMLKIICNPQIEC